VDLPSCLEGLTFGQKFNQSIEQVMICQLVFFHSAFCYSSLFCLLCFNFFLSLVAMAFPMASSLTLEFGDWSDADSIGEVSAYGNASVSSGSTCASDVEFFGNRQSQRQYLLGLLSSDEESETSEEPINFIQLEDNIFPFEVHTHPLYASDIYQSIQIAVVKAMLEFQNKGLLSRDVSYQHFILDVMDGYVSPSRKPDKNVRLSPRP
jgi:hypothetical protein